MDRLETESPHLAQVLSLSLHRLQRAPCAVHRAFLTRPSLFRVLRNVKGIYRASGVSFLKDRAQSEMCFIEIIVRAQESILIADSAARDPILQAALDAVRSEKPEIQIREIRSHSFVLVIDEQTAMIGKGDLGVVVEGPIAKQISHLFQISLRSKTSVPSSLRWPHKTRVDLEGIDIGLSRTWTSPDLPPLIEIERLLLSAIKSAKRFVYIEAEQFKSPVIANAIIQRLRRSKRSDSEDCPEFVLLLTPAPTNAFLQMATLARILKADTDGRVRVFERPAQSDLGSLMIVDDQFLKVGTSQLTSQSLGARNEVDISIEALGRPNIVTAIAKLRRERLGALLGLEPSEFDARFLLNGSLIDTIDSFFTVNRHLKEIAPDATPWTQFAFAVAPLIDPKRPHAISRWLRRRFQLASKFDRFAIFLLTIFAILVTFASVFAPFGL